MKIVKRIISTSFLLLLAIAFTSCDKGPVSETYLTIKNSTWDRFDIKQFDIPVAEPAQTYDITLVVRCSEKFQYDKLPVYAIITTASGEERMREVNLLVRENGKMITQPESTNSEARLILWKGVNMGDKGTCKITLENMIPKIQTDGINEIGIVVTKSE
jgi:gliding motility-associated lipoprotein GldH